MMANVSGACRRCLVGVAAASWVFGHAGLARAEGFSGRLFHVATDPRGVGTVEAAHGPDAGSLVMGLTTDFMRGPLTLVGSNGSAARVASRLVSEASFHAGLGSRFTLSGRVPIAVFEDTVDALGPTPSPGALPPAASLTVPLYREPFSDGQVAVRGEVEFPLGDSEAFRGNSAFTAAPSLVYSTPFGPIFGVVSAGARFAPTRVTGPAGFGTAITVDAATRWPAQSRFALAFSGNARIQADAPNDGFWLGAAGGEGRFGDLSLRVLGGAHGVFSNGAPTAWVGFAVTYAFRVVVAAPPAAP